MARKRIGILCYDGVNALDVAGPAEAFASATHCGTDACYEVVLAGPGPSPVRAESGLLLQPHCSFAQAPEFDTVIVPGGCGLREPASHLVDNWLASQADKVRRIAAVCTGAYALARLGMLDDRRATTHWRYASDLAARYPRVQVDADALFIRDGNVYTSAGITAAIDLALALIEEDFGPQTSLAVARELVVYLKRPGGQAQYSGALQYQARAGERFGDLAAWIVTHLDADLSVEALAARANLSSRQFNRRFTETFGMTPAAFIQEARMGEARQRLLGGAAGIERLADSLGYASAGAFRRAFEKHYGLPPAAYRERFGGARDV